MIPQSFKIHQCLTIGFTPRESSGFRYCDTRVFWHCETRIYPKIGLTTKQGSPRGIKMGFSPMYWDMGLVYQTYYIRFEWGQLLSSSIVWGEVGWRKEVLSAGFKPGRMEWEFFFGGSCGYFIIRRADISIRLRILHEGRWQFYAWFYVKWLNKCFKK